MGLDFKQIPYQDLNSRQQETYNFQKVSALLADFGYLTIRLSDDWNGADFIAQHFKTKMFLKVQLKSRLTFDKKYEDEDLYICFKDGKHGAWYMYNHAELLKKILAEGQLEETDARVEEKACQLPSLSKHMDEKKPYHFPVLSIRLKKLLEPYQIPEVDSDS